VPCFSPYALRLFALTPINNLQHRLNYAHSFSASRFLNGLIFFSSRNIILVLWLFYLRLLFREEEKGVKRGLGVYIDMNGGCTHLAVRSTWRLNFYVISRFSE